MTTIVQSNKKKRTESTLEIIRLKKKKNFLVLQTYNVLTLFIAQRTCSFKKLRLAYSNENSLRRSILRFFFICTHRNKYNVRIEAGCVLVPPQIRYKRLFFFFKNNNVYFNNKDRGDAKLNIRRANASILFGKDLALPRC